jgi:UrcA family protein
MLIHYKALSLYTAVAVTATGLFPVTPAYAQSEPITVTGPRVSILQIRRVNYADLNLAYWQHQRVLVSRVNFAVKQVCAERLQNKEHTLAAFTRYTQCREYAWSGAAPQVARAVYRAQLRYG